VRHSRLFDTDTAVSVRFAHSPLARRSTPTLDLSMAPLHLSPTTPKRVDPRVRQLLVALDLPETQATWLPLHRPKKFSPERNECHINAWIQMKYEGGTTCTGWMIWQDRAADFLEAQFHTVWRDSAGLLRDVTPRQDKERLALFVPDAQREVRLTNYDGAPAIITFDNVRMKNGALTNILREQTHVLVTELIYVHGLAFRGAAIPNSSINQTCPGSPGHAAHVGR
jgi:hypothetical protein